METQGQCHVKMKDQGIAYTSQGMSNIDSKPQEARKRQGRIPQQASEGTWPCQHQDFRLLSLQNYKRTNFCCVKSTSLWYFATAALGNEYNFKIIE